MTEFSFKALMVDVDGVLINGRGEDRKHWSTDIEHDLNLSGKILNEKFFIPYWDKIITGKIDLISALKPVLLKIAPHLTADDLIAYWFKNDAFINVDLINCLKTLRKQGIYIGLATNQEHMRAAYITNNLRLGDVTNAVFYSAKLGIKKPDTQFFEKISELSGYQPNEILFLDDSKANIASAKNSGWNTMLWTDKSDPSSLLSLF